MEDPKIEIYDIMACNVYVDYVFAKVKEQHKFLIAFLPVKDAFLPDYIDKITAYGPDGYEVEFKNQEYNLKNVNGYITDAAFNSCWYMVNLPTGFLNEGEYKIEVECKNGEVKTKSRYQKNAPSEALVGAYLENKDALYKSYYPSTTNKIPKGTPLKNLKVKFSTLKELADLDAYYIYRVSLGKTPLEFNIQKLVWWDNVFVERYVNAKAGLNKGENVIKKELKPNTSYAYFVETTDSNAMGETNICVFQPHQIFTTPPAQQVVTTPGV
ncbi:MAG: hypothetical protein WED07_01440 [Candidatus Freyarchaeum deiterrae]